MEYRVVLSKAGRDKGRLLAVTGETETELLLCDGKERPLERPKSKNRKHVSFTHYVLEENQLSTNKSLRKALAMLSARE